MYQKDYVVKQDMGNRIWCEPYVVQKNDSLIQVFKEKGGIIDENPEEFLKIFKRLNPLISDLESRPGQQIFIPLKKVGPDHGLSSRIFTLPMVTISAKKSQPATEPKPPSDAAGFTEYKIKQGETLSQIFLHYFGSMNENLFREKLRLFKKINPDIADINRIHAGRILHMPIFDTGSGVSHEDPAGALEKISSLLQAKLIRKGIYYFPMQGKADFKLDLAQFPLMEFSDGLRILFNPGQSLMQDDCSVMLHFWQDIRIIEVSYDASYEAILEKVLNVAPYLNERIEKTRQASDPELLQATASSSPIPSTGRHVPVHGRQQLVETLMRILGVSYAQNVEITFPYAGVQISSHANWIWSDKGKSILVDFGTFYGDAIQSLEKAGFSVIQILDADSSYEGVSKLLNALAVFYSMDPEIRTAGRPPLRIPGIWIERNGLASLILTEADLNPEMIQAVQEKGIIIITEKRTTG